VTDVADTTRWGAKAASLYDGAYAARYRSHDESLVESAAYGAFVVWLQQVCGMWPSPFDALDLGCGTGRYFCALRGVRTLIGFDASSDMLAQARHPLHEDRITAGAITLVHGDLMEQDFGAERFDLVYSIGVLAEHVPLRPALVASVARWLRPGGRFALSTVHPESPSVPRTRTSPGLRTTRPAAATRRTTSRRSGPTGTRASSTTAGTCIASRRSSGRSSSGSSRRTRS